MTGRLITKSDIDQLMAVPATQAEMDLVLDVLRTNRLHESRCALLRNLRDEEAMGCLILPRPDCDCWLAQDS